MDLFIDICSFSFNIYQSCCAIVNVNLLFTELTDILCFIAAHLQSSLGHPRHSPTLCLSVMSRLAVILHTVSGKNESGVFQA